MLRNIKINKFRHFENVSFDLGKNITIIAGTNATGKSTLLAMLGNSCEEKNSFGINLIHSKFRTQFGEIIKGSSQFDLKGSDLFKISFCDYNDFNIETDYRSFRISWQDNNTRFRIIPKREKNISKNLKKTEAKYNFPSMYLGLSRLFPIGESKTLTNKKINFQNDELDWITKAYKNILHMNNENINEINHLDIEIKNKQGFGITTDLYDYLANSAGQDNLGQILLAVLSFKRLKEKNPKYNGGLLLIDEFDATLHPASQRKLLDFLEKESKELNLQIVFTTHSLTLLETICTNKIKRNNHNDFNEYELIYLSSAYDKLKIYQKENINYNVIESDLRLICNYHQLNSKRVSIFSEDEETRWFAKNLLQNYDQYLKYLNISIGCSELLKFRKEESEYFSKVLIILDGDVKENTIKKTVSNFNSATPILKLPVPQKTELDDSRPETIIYNFLISLPGTHEYWSHAEKIAPGFTPKYIQVNGPLSEKYNNLKKTREKYKKWFNENKAILNNSNMFSYWYSENKSISDEFIKKFIFKYNIIAHNNTYRIIDKEIQ